MKKKIKIIAQFQKFDSCQSSELQVVTREKPCLMRQFETPLCCLHSIFLLCFLVIVGMEQEEDEDEQDDNELFAIGNRDGSYLFQ